MTEYFCKFYGKKVKTEVVKSKPQLSENSSYRIQSFRCSEEDNCEDYKKQQCEYIKNIKYK